MVLHPTTQQLVNHATAVFNLLLLFLLALLFVNTDASGKLMLSLVACAFGGAALVALTFDYLAHRIMFWRRE